MVKITNGINVFEVTSGAYDGIYKYQGYQVIGDDGGNDDFGADGDNGKHNMSADEMFVGEVVKKPVSQWGKDEVKRYASIKGIDISGTRSVNEAKDIIKNAMIEEE